MTTPTRQLSGGKRTSEPATKSLLTQGTLIPLGSILVLAGVLFPLVWSHASEQATAVAERGANSRAIDANRDAIDAMRGELQLIRQELTDIRESQIRMEEHMGLKP